MTLAPPAAPPDTRCRAIVRGGAPCRCGGWWEDIVVDIYPQCVCGHTRPMHGSPDPKPKAKK